jgi:hypothetical protein
LTGALTGAFIAEAMYAISSSDSESDLTSWIVGL